ncbi:hypothetical protein BSKO_11104 [Bryopsis sp. KO-2023]|nr:hypothetical protein BSKO_11104 [Bryopsis sp. KO-2023]
MPSSFLMSGVEGGTRLVGSRSPLLRGRVVARRSRGDALCKCVSGSDAPGPARCPPLRAQGLRVPPTLPLPTSNDEHEGDDDEGSSTQEALFNAVNILMGVGLLSIPYSLNEGGWASLGVLGVIWGCTNYTGKILIKCQEVNSYRAKRKQLEETSNAASMDVPVTVEAVVVSEKLESDSPAVASTSEPSTSVVSDSPKESFVGKVLKSYEDIGEAAFGPEGRKFITTILYAELIGTCALFFILEGDHLRMLLEQLMPHRSLPSREELMAMSAGIFLPTTWLTDLSSLSYVGAFGVLSALGLTGVVTYEFFHGGMQIADTVAVHGDTLPSAFGLIAFVFAGHAVFPSIYASMKDKQEYGPMLDKTYMIVGATCITMGIAGYCMYGSGTMEEVTLNLPPGLLSLVSTSLILVSPFTKFALTLEPVARGVEQHLGISIKGPTGNLARLNRTGLGLGALFLATQVPYFAQVMSIVGSFLTITVSVMFPALCHLKLFDEDLETNEKYLNYLVLALGGFCAVSGTWTAVQELLKQLS